MTLHFVWGHLSKKQTLRNNNLKLPLQFSPYSVQNEPTFWHNLEDDCNYDDEPIVVDPTLCEDYDDAEEDDNSEREEVFCHGDIESAGQNEQIPPLKTPSKSKSVTKAKVVYQCKVCDYVTDQKQAHDRHQRTHTGEKPFPCTQPLCSRSFSLKGDLTRFGH